MSNVLPLGDPKAPWTMTPQSEIAYLRRLGGAAEN
jgi:hypothetical protein